MEPKKRDNHPKHHKKGNGGKGPRPHTWLCGPDEYKHQMYVPWMMSKAQATFREEFWELTFEEFFDIWNGHWHARGRLKDNLCLTRIDCEGAWTKKNVELLTRQEHIKKNMAYLTRNGPRTYNKNKRQS